MTDSDPTPAEEEVSADDFELEQVEHEIEADIASIAAQRDEYLALAQRLQAEFENYKKQTVRRNTEVVEQASAQLAEKLLPVLDAFDNAIIHGIDGIGPLYKVMLDVLQKEGLDVIDTDGVVFDPNLHEAVMHEEGDDEQEREHVPLTGDEAVPDDRQRWEVR